MHRFSAERSAAHSSATGSDGLTTQLTSVTERFTLLCIMMAEVVKDQQVGEEGEPGDIEPTTGIPLSEPSLFLDLLPPFTLTLPSPSLSEGGGTMACSNVRGLMRVRRVPHKCDGVREREGMHARW